jgi:hypothetical protein
MSLIWFEVPILSTGINFQQTSHHETTTSYKEYFLKCLLHMVKIFCSSEHKFAWSVQLVSLLASSKSTHRQLQGFFNLLTNHSNYCIGQFLGVFKESTYNHSHVFYLRKCFSHLLWLFLLAVEHPSKFCKISKSTYVCNRCSALHVITSYFWCENMMTN